MNLPQILVVDDDHVFAREARERFAGKAEITDAITVAQGEEQFLSRADWALIIIDACVPGHDITTEALVRLIRKSYDGPLVAFSSLPPYQEMLVQAGCDRRWNKLKFFDELRKFLEP